jgi:Na+/proline symporter
MQIAILDWAVVLAYFILIGVIGLLAARKVKDTQDYFLGKRSFGKLLMIGQSFGVGTHADMPVSMTGAVYSIGFSAIWYQWKNLFATPFFWLVAPIFRRLRRTTVAESVEDRYGTWMGGIYTFFAIVFFVLGFASMLKGAAKVISQAMGGHVGVNQVVVGMTIAFIVYSFVGGLMAAAWTDLFQSFLIIILSFLLIPFGWQAIGGVGAIRENLTANQLSLTTPNGVGVWIIFALTLNGLIGIMAQPHMMATVGTGKDESACRTGFFYGMFVKRICTVGWAFIGLIVAVIIKKGTLGVSVLADPENAFGFACRHLLFPGGIGLMIAAVLAASMSTGSALMVDSGALFTQCVYRKLRLTGRSDQHYLLVGRISGFLTTLVGVVYAFFLVDRVLYSFLLAETLATFMGISVLGGIVWARANRWGAASSFLVALVINFGLYEALGKRLDDWDATVFLIATGAGALTLIVVSLLTPPEPPSKLQVFFGNLHTPSNLEFVPAEKLAQVGNGPVAESSTEAMTGEELVLLNLASLRSGNLKSFARACRHDLVGFGIGWALVLGLVGGLWLVLKYMVR